MDNEDAASVGTGATHSLNNSVTMNGVAPVEVFSDENSPIINKVRSRVRRAILEETVDKGRDLTDEKLPNEAPTKKKQVLTDRKISTGPKKRRRTNKQVDFADECFSEDPPPRKTKSGIQDASNDPVLQPRKRSKRLESKRQTATASGPPLDLNEVSQDDPELLGFEDAQASSRTTTPGGQSDGSSPPERAGCVKKKRKAKSRRFSVEASDECFQEMRQKESLWQCGTTAATVVAETLNDGNSDPDLGGRQSPGKSNTETDSDFADLPDDIVLPDHPNEALVPWMGIMADLAGVSADSLRDVYEKRLNENGQNAPDRRKFKSEKSVPFKKQNSKSKPDDSNHESKKDALDSEIDSDAPSPFFSDDSAAEEEMLGTSHREEEETRALLNSIALDLLKQSPDEGGEQIFADVAGRMSAAEKQMRQNQRAKYISLTMLRFLSEPQPVWTTTEANCPPDLPFVELPLKFQSLTNPAAEKRTAAQTLTSWAFLADTAKTWCSQQGLILPSAKVLEHHARDGAFSTFEKTWLRNDKIEYLDRPKGDAILSAYFPEAVLKLQSAVRLSSEDVDEAATLLKQLQLSQLIDETKLSRFRHCVISSCDAPSLPSANMPRASNLEPADAVDPGTRSEQITVQQRPSKVHRKQTDSNLESKQSPTFNCEGTDIIEASSEQPNKEILTVPKLHLGISDVQCVVAAVAENCPTRSCSCENHSNEHDVHKIQRGPQLETRPKERMASQIETGTEEATGTEEITGAEETTGIEEEAAARHDSTTAPGEHSETERALSDEDELWPENVFLGRADGSPGKIPTAKMSGENEADSTRATIPSKESTSEEKTSVFENFKEMATGDSHTTESNESNSRKHRKDDRLVIKARIERKARELAERQLEKWRQRQRKRKERRKRLKEKMFLDEEASESEENDENAPARSKKSHRSSSETDSSDDDLTWMDELETDTVDQGWTSDLFEYHREQVEKAREGIFQRLFRRSKSRMLDNEEFTASLTRAERMKLENERRELQHEMSEEDAWLTVIEDYRRKLQETRDLSSGHGSNFSDDSSGYCSDGSDSDAELGGGLITGSETDLTEANNIVPKMYNRNKRLPVQCHTKRSRMQKAHAAVAMLHHSKRFATNKTEAGTNENGPLVPRTTASVSFAALFEALEQTHS